MVDLGPDGFFAISRLGTLIAFRKGHANAQRHRRICNRQLGSAGAGSLAGLIFRLHRHGRGVGNYILLVVFLPVHVLADHSHGIVMSPVHGKVAKGRHLPAILIGCCSAYGQGQRISIVVCIQGQVYAFIRVICLDPVIRGIYTRGIIHPVIGNTQAHRVLASGKVACHVDDMAGILRRTADAAGLNTLLRFFAGFLIRVHIPVAGNGYNIILVQIVKGQGTHTAQTLLTDADARRHGYDIRVHVRRGFYRTCC